MERGGHGHVGRRGGKSRKTQLVSLKRQTGLEKLSLLRGGGCRTLEAMSLGLEEESKETRTGTRRTATAVAGLTTVTTLPCTSKKE